MAKSKMEDVLVYASAALVILGAIVSASYTIRERQKTAEKDSLIQKQTDEIVENSRALRNQSNTIEALNKELIQKSNKIESLNKEIMVKQEESIEENEYRSFRSGIVYDKILEREIREWFNRVKSHGINPPHFPFLIIIKRSYGMRMTPTMVDISPLQNNRILIGTAQVEYPNVAVWRGLSHVILGAEIIEVPKYIHYMEVDAIGPGHELYIDQLMYQAFKPITYLKADEKTKRQYWEQVFFEPE